MTKKIFFITTILLLLSFFIIPVQAQNSIDITLNQPSFQPTEKVEARVIFTNNFTKTITGRLSCYFISLDDQLPSGTQTQQIDLTPRQKSQPLTCSMTIGTIMPDGPYRLQAEVHDQYNTLVSKAHKDFVVTGTLKEINAELLICPDADCQERQKVFIKGENIYLKLKTYLTDLQINASLNGQPITFSNNLAQIKAEVQGSYLIDLTLNKQGYAEQAIKTDFAVLDQPAKITSLDQSQPGLGKYKLYIIIALGLVVLVIMILIIKKIYVRRSKIPPTE